ncbi:MAG: NAD-dependent epimerase/dehydratase family protein [Pseudonocardiaceae bacterium]|nr:NAD-dependent epimerase/dehydratase family protein [Pseudonocardiaceae bacterium]
MRVLVIGGTVFLGRRVVERLHERGDRVLLVHRSHSEPADWVPVDHLRADRRDLARHNQSIRDFAPQAVVDTCALTAADVEAVLPIVPDVPTVVLSSQDVYQAHAALLAGRCDAPVPLTEDSELRRERYPYRGLNLPEVPDDYSKRARTPSWPASPTARCPRISRSQPRRPSTCSYPSLARRNFSAGRLQIRLPGSRSRCTGTSSTRPSIRPGPTTTTPSTRRR